LQLGWGGKSPDREDRVPRCLPPLTPAAIAARLASSFKSTEFGIEQKNVRLAPIPLPYGRHATNLPRLRAITVRSRRRNGRELLEAKLECPLESTANQTRLSHRVLAFPRPEVRWVPPRIRARTVLLGSFRMVQATANSCGTTSSQEANFAGGAFSRKTSTNRGTNPPSSLESARAWERTHYIAQNKRR